MHLLVIEDEGWQAEELEQALRGAYPPPATITILRSEFSFRAWLAEKAATAPPDVAVIDRMVKWTDNQRNAPSAPPDVTTGGMHMAGRRVASALRRTYPLTAIIHYSVLEAPPDARTTDDAAWIVKGPTLTPLLQEIERAVHSRSRPGALSLLPERSGPLR